MNGDTIIGDWVEGHGSGRNVNGAHIWAGFAHLSRHLKRGMGQRKEIGIGERFRRRPYDSWACQGGPLCGGVGSTMLDTDGWR